TDENVLHEWFGTGRYQNLAIAIPDDVVVIDVDVHGDVDGRETTKLWDAEHGTHWRDGVPHATTAGGGDHYLFRRPEGRLRKNPGPGVDCLWKGKYIVAAPSVVGAGAYHWITPMASDGEFPVMESFLAHLC